MATPGQSPMGARGTEAYTQLRGIIGGADEPPAETPDEQPEEVAGDEIPEEPESPPEEEPTSEELSDEAAEAEDDEDGGDTPSLRTLNDVAEALGTDADSLSGVNVTVKVDGEEQEIPLGDALKSYQLQGHVNKKSMELSEKQKELQQHLDYYQQQVGQRVEQLDQLSQALQGELLPQQNLDQLREEDFEAYMQARDRQDRVKERIQQVQQERQRHQQEAQQAHAQKMQQFLEEQEKQLGDRIPDWNDPEKAKTEKAKLRTYLNGRGFTDEEVGQVADARVVEIARKAMLYDNLQSSKAEVTKKVQSKPKYQKPGSANQKRNRKQEAQKRNWDQFRKSRGRDRSAAVSVFKDVIKQG